MGAGSATYSKCRDWWGTHRRKAHCGRARLSSQGSGTSDWCTLWCTTKQWSTWCSISGSSTSWGVCLNPGWFYGGCAWWVVHVYGCLAEVVCHTFESNRITLTMEIYRYSKFFFRLYLTLWQLCPSIWTVWSSPSPQMVSRPFLNGDKHFLIRFHRLMLLENPLKYV
jgi:hypothetical protein